MTAESIDAGDGGEYARYLEEKTRSPERGAYYLTPEGEPQQPPGRWLAQPESLALLGIEAGALQGADFVALMEGKHPQTGRWLRREGAGGGRGGGIDVTFSAPKSVSIKWALSDEQGRAAIETAHSHAVKQALEYLREEVPTIRRRIEGKVVEARAVDLLAAEYRHTTTRGLRDGELPDPHLHSHVVITSAIRDDGRVVAVASRPIFRSARQVGAYYRSALAAELAGQGLEVQPRTGRHGRYFELAEIDLELKDAFSRRSREVARAAERFRARRGRAPRRGELRQLKRNNRLAKKLVNRGDLDRAWQALAEQHSPQLEREAAERQALVHAGESVPGRRHHDDPQRPLAQVIEDRLTEQAATFTLGELTAVALEQSVGLLGPDQALELVREMTASRAIVPLVGEKMTTLALRAEEQRISRALIDLCQPAGRDVGDRVRAAAADRVAERIGAPLAQEQLRALAALTGPERVAILIGPAGTGKGVVIDAAARAEQLVGREVYGIAVAGDTAQRLGCDCPGLQERTLTLDGLVARAEHGRLEIDEHTTICLDEAGMADTHRLSRLVDLIERTDAKLVLVGDSAQLPSIGAGGMFEHLTKHIPTVHLGQVRRTEDPAEQQAWAALRDGESDRAMAHYHAQGRLNIADDRDQAIERATQTWARLARTHGPAQILLLSDASNQEINRINARAQHLLGQQGKLGERELPIPGLHYGIRQGDRIALTAQHRQDGLSRIENGSRGHVVEITPQGEAILEFDITGQRRTLQGDELATVRLGYARHIHGAQGATVTHTLVITGGWQTSRQTAYVQATRARHGTTWFVNRADLGTDGQDADRIQRLSTLMRTSRAQTPSLAHQPTDPHLDHTDLSALADQLHHTPIELATAPPEHPLYETLKPSILTRYLHRLTGRAAQPPPPTPPPPDHQAPDLDRAR